MKHILLTAAFALAAAPALAGSCPADMAAIDAAMESASLSEGDMTKVKALRAEGEELHDGGDHAASMAKLAEAKSMLGID
ncbi:hypothetical protein EI983_13155 [Roseovarius faecimaris]|uniref:Uncharacterized protein n=1 Tax=Roseovarius faecimaris TaxID=2494550 RepID=A0A6I6ISQ1_9RHOB|nr:hypothetical protein [Roseovarius faecimaris]QGX99164.1 hypothetical protein EI983_13155 [Roseovarius faecimaris]